MKEKILLRKRKWWGYVRPKLTIPQVEAAIRALHAELVNPMPQEERRMVEIALKVMKEALDTHMRKMHD